jgi:MurNAc alpha-1-phosphate uridylyltransferase
MKIKRAIILCAGFGKRVQPLTNTTPKPLLVLNGKSLVEYGIQFLKDFGVEDIAMNTHYLSDQIKNFVDKKKYNFKIFHEEVILDTGGALTNAIDFFKNDYFIVLNSDTVWQHSYLPSLKKLSETVFKKNLKGGLLFSSKEKSFDKTLPGDFGVDSNFYLTSTPKNYIYTGCQILHPSVLKNIKNEPFSVKKIWDDLVSKKQLCGQVIDTTFYHTTNLEIYHKLQKENIIY